MRSQVRTLYRPFCHIFSVPRAKNCTQIFILPAASFTAKSSKSYKCSKTAATEGCPITAATGLDKCVFSVLIKGADLDVTSGDVNFNGFNEMANLNLLQEF